MKKSYWIFSLVAVAVVILDQVTKYIVNTSMLLHDSMPIINGLFNFTYVKNPGAAFGFLAGAPPFFRSVFFIGVTVAAIMLILYYIRKTKTEEPLLTTSFSLIMGGAVGNLIDRVRFGEVIDFLDLYIGPHHWPAFNIADSAISVGAILLIYDMIHRKDRMRSF
jgi:signal peptidase II